VNRRRFQPARRFQPTNLADVYPIFIDFASVVQTVSLETTAEKRPVRTRALPRMSRRESTNIGSIYVGAFAPSGGTCLPRVCSHSAIDASDRRGGLDSRRKAAQQVRCQKREFRRAMPMLSISPSLKGVAAARYGA
jgi:hypothetical protein